MAQIEVIRDPQIKQSPIVHTLQTPRNENVSTKNDYATEVQQTKVFGLLVPIIALNSVAVDWQDVLEFTLDDTKHIPSCTFAFRDRNNIFSKYSHTGNDNELRVQILPAFDDTYKKIDLTFLVTEIKINSGEVRGAGTYMLRKFTESKFQALGQISTYELLDKISLDTGLGFSSNVQVTEDTRFMQCSFESYKDTATREIEKSGASEVHVYDWWVDCWNHMVLCDLYDRINNEDSEEDMAIWMVRNTNQASVHQDPEPIKTCALFTNSPALQQTSSYVFDYDVENAPVTATKGNSYVLSVYEENKKESIDHYATDGDTIKNEFIKFEYLGEVYGDYNYFLAEKLRNIYLNKTKSEVVVIHMADPQLGVMRGDQCRFVWYDNNTLDSTNQKVYEETGAIASEEELSTQVGWLKDWIIEHKNDNNAMSVNLQYSGQYTSIGQYITYDGSIQQWNCWLYLVRPASKRPIISQIDVKK